MGTQDQTCKYYHTLMPKAVKDALSEELKGELVAHTIQCNGCYDRYDFIKDLFNLAGRLVAQASREDRAFSSLCDGGDVAKIVQECGLQYFDVIDPHSKGERRLAVLATAKVRTGIFGVEYSLGWNRQKESAYLVKGPDFLLNGKRTKSIPEQLQKQVHTLDARIHANFEKTD